MNFINDCISDVDMLGYEPYIKAFEYLIENQNELMNLPIVFGIHGKWGVGKSTFMKLVQLELGKSNKYYTVKINPWEFAGESNFVSVFIAELYKTIKEDLCDEEKGKEDSINKFLKAILKPLKISTTVSTIPKMHEIKAEYDFGKLTFDSQKELVDKYITENYEIKDTIDSILDYEIFENKKIVVFIDDLDRCTENKVLEVIESIKLILNSENCIFFLGCDKEYLESALSVKYKEFIQYLQINESENVFKKFADEYLEKIIQIPFYIPSLNEEAVNNYINELLNKKEVHIDTLQNNKKENYFETYKNIINVDLFTKLFMEINLNPRRIKRILNITFLNYLFLKFKNFRNNLRDNDLDLLILLGLLRDGYSNYYKRKLISEMLCKRTFENMLNNLINKKVKVELADDDKKVSGLFNIFFKMLKIKNKNDLDNLLLNIGTILTISKTTTSDNYDELYWGTIGEIKSKTGTNKRLKSFLNRVKDNKVLSDFLLWLFGDIYDDENFYLGIEKNVHFYNQITNNHYENFILKVEYDEIKENLLIRFESGKYVCILDDISTFKGNKYYNSTSRQICITKNQDEDTINLIKEGIYKLLIGE